MRSAAFVLVAAFALDAAIAAGLGAAPVRDGAILTNSGSTNIRGYQVAIWSDGAAALIDGGARRPLAGIAPALARQFFIDAKRTRAAGATGGSCTKSVSFGTRTTVAWHGWTSPDLSCPTTGAARALAADVAQIQATLAVRPAPRRPLRRALQIMKPAVSPSP